MVLILAFKNLFRKKLRTILNLILIVLNTIVFIYCLIILSSIEHTANQGLINSICGHFAVSKEANSTDMFEPARPDKTDYFSKDEVMEVEAKLKANSQTAAVSQSLIFSGMGIRGKNTLPVIVMGVNPAGEARIVVDFSKIFENFSPTHTTFMCSTYIAQKLNISEGDSIFISSQTSRGGVRSIKISLEKVLSPKILLDSHIQPLIVVDMTVARYLLHLKKEEASHIFVRLKGDNLVNNKISGIMRQMRNNFADSKLNFISPFQMLPVFEHSFITARIMAWGEDAVFILLMMFALINVALINYREQKRDLGTLKALGMNNRLIFYYFLTQILLQVGMGYVIGFFIMYTDFLIIKSIFPQGISLAGNEILQYAYGGKIILPKLDLSSVALGLIFFLFISTSGVAFVCHKAAKLRINENIRGGL